MKTEAIETQLGLPALQNLAYSQAEPIAAQEVSTPWRDAYVRAARIGLLGAFAAMAIVAASVAVPHHYSTAAAVSNTWAGASSPARPPQDVPPRPLVIPPDAEKVSVDERFINVLSANWAPYNRHAAWDSVPAGQRACKLLAGGSTVEGIIRDNTGVNDDGYGWTPDLVRGLIRASTSVYCPQFTG
jgi:hypothetical protein